MKDVHNIAEERASRLNNMPPGRSFETEHQRAKKALVNQINALDGFGIHMIAATSAGEDEEERIITCGMRCRGYNAKLNGSVANSKHLTGQATDFYMQGVTETLSQRKKAVRVIKKLANHT